MGRYTIGRIDGRWENMVPPIQGGRFRTKEEMALDAGLGDSDDSDETSTDGTGSPLFDPAEAEPSSTRRRRGPLSDKRRSSSVSSMSSLDQESLPPGKAYLDSQTQAAIDSDLARYPPLDPATQDDIVQKYRQLDARIRAEGLYQCSYSAYLVEACRYALIFAASMASIHRGWYAAGGIFMGMFWHQLVFTAHDAGHMGITHGFHTDTVIGIIIADFLGGLRSGLVEAQPQRAPHRDQLARARPRH